MKRSFAVVTDSTADLPDEWRDRYAIEVVPLKVLFGTETFRDRVDLVAHHVSSLTRRVCRGI
jgi:fatty acid-binding protein DegV